jgi:hypothetical protein
MKRSTFQNRDHVAGSSTTFKVSGQCIRLD